MTTTTLRQLTVCSAFLLLLRLPTHAQSGERTCLQGSFTPGAVTRGVVRCTATQGTASGVKDIVRSDTMCTLFSVLIKVGRQLA